jgi:hypothetical protein
MDLNQVSLSTGPQTQGWGLEARTPNLRIGRLEKIKVAVPSTELKLLNLTFMVSTLWRGTLGLRAKQDLTLYLNRDLQPN